MPQSLGKFQSENPLFLSIYVFQVIDLRILTDTTSVELEPSQQMSCSVSSSFETEDEATLNNASVASINATFELSQQDIRLVLIFFNSMEDSPFKSSWPSFNLKPSKLVCYNYE